MKTTTAVIITMIVVWVLAIFTIPITKEYVVDNPGNLYDLKDSCELELNGEFLLTDVYPQDDWVEATCMVKNRPAFHFGFRAAAEREISGLEGPFLADFTKWTD